MFTHVESFNKMTAEFTTTEWFYKITDSNQRYTGSLMKEANFVQFELHSLQIIYLTFCTVAHLHTLNKLQLHLHRAPFSR